MALGCSRPATPAAMIGRRISGSVCCLGGPHGTSTPPQHRRPPGAQPSAGWHPGAHSLPCPAPNRTHRTPRIAPNTVQLSTHAPSFTGRPARAGGWSVLLSTARPQGAHCHQQTHNPHAAAILRLATASRIIHSSACSPHAAPVGVSSLHLCAGQPPQRTPERTATCSACTHGSRYPPVRTPPKLPTSPLTAAHDSCCRD